MMPTSSNMARELVRAAGDARKALVALLGVAAMLTELNMLHGNSEHWATIGTAAATAAVTYLAPNGPFLRALGKLEQDGDVGVGLLDTEPAELTAPTSKPALDPAPLVTGTLAPAQRPMPGRHEA